MLRIIQSKSAEQAKSYYLNGLSREDYYTDGQELTGNWQGRGAELLGLGGKVDQNAFFDLYENRDPATGERLTPRSKEERTVGYDFNYHAPKSVSAMYAHTGDERFITALRDAVRETMREIETEMKTRVRVGGVQEERATGNMAYAEFVHKTARPVDGKPDPHLHVHCFVMNATYDAVEDRFKAGQFRDIKRDACYFEAAFHARLANNVKDLGYAVEPKGRFWEIEGVPQSVIDKYSRRRDQIEALAGELGITDAKEKDRLGATSREKKVHLSMEELSAEWASRLTPQEIEAMNDARLGKRGKETQIREPISPAQQAIDHGLKHVFERMSVSSEKDVLEEALRFGVGKVEVEEVKAAFARDPRIVRKEIKGEKRCTTLEVQQQERKLVAFAKETRGVLEPIKGEPHQFTDGRLNPTQREAVSHVLTSRDQVTMIRGGAGVGKTTLMREAVAAINEAGYKVQALAPTADASRAVLRAEGFANANTLESFLSNTALQRKMAGQVIWVDEAGLLSAHATERLFNVVRDNASRLILTGDTAQHHSVERGDVMRLLEKHAGLPVREVQEIIRQKREYKTVIEDIRKGQLDQAFGTLEKMGAIRENGDIGALHKQLAGDYVELSKQRKSVLIVVPQHQEIKAVTKAVREKLRENGDIKGDEHKVTKLTNLQLTEAERADARHYEPGRVVQFVQNAPGFKRGERFSVVDCERSNVMVKDASGATKDLPLGMSGRFQLYSQEEMQIAAGDQLRITQNRFSKGGQRLDNGSLHEVSGFTSDGDIELKNGAVLPKDFGHMTHGYCVTSYSSQSKTVNVPLIAQSSLSFNASSLEQIYVSLSRGNEGVRIYTDDLKELRERVARSTTRESALDLGEDQVESGLRRNMLDTTTDMNRWQKAWQERREYEKHRSRGLEKECERYEPREGSKGSKERGRGMELTMSI